MLSATDDTARQRLERPNRYDYVYAYIPRIRVTVATRLMATM